jgi:hypothetical protein
LVPYSARRYPRRRVRHAEPTTKWQNGHEAETKIEKKKIEAALEKCGGHQLMSGRT